MPGVNAIPNITPNAVSNQQNGLLQSMHPGQSVTVEVISAEPGMLTVKTPDGQTLSAEFPGATVMAKGDQLELTLLSSSQGDHPQFKLSAVNNQNVNITTSVMESKMIDLGVEPSEINVKAAEFLAERGVQPTPERLATLAKIATYFPELPASTALFAATNNIAPTRSNISALAEWLAGDDLLGNDVQSLTQEVKDILKEVSMTVKESVNTPVQNPEMPHTVAERTVDAQIQTPQAFAQNFVGEVIKNPEFPAHTISLPALTEFAEGLANLPQEEAQAAINEFLNNYPSLTGEEKAVLSDILNNVYSQTTQNISPEVELQASVNNLVILPDNQPNNAESTQPNNATMAQPNNAALAQPNDADSIHPDNPVTAQPKNIASAQPNRAELAQPQQNLQNGSVQQAETLQNSDQTQPTAAGEQIGAAVENPDIKQENNPIPQQSMQSADPQSKVEIKAEAQKILGQIEKLVVSMKNDNAADAAALKESVKTQQRTADSIKEGMTRIAGENSVPTQKAGDMATRIQLGNQIDNFYYCQVPFKMGENQNTAELYVFNRKKGDASSDRINTTILIALETQRMGRVETVLRAEDNSLNLEFRVETDKIQRYLEKETAQLKEQLEESSFNVVGIKVVRIDVPVTPLNVDQLVGEKEEFELKTIDISV